MSRVTNSFSFESVGKAFVPKRFRHKIQEYVLKAGEDEVPYRSFGFMFYFIIFVTFVLYILPQLHISEKIAEYYVFSQFLLTFGFWVGSMLVLSLLYMAGFWVMYELRIFQRQMQIEEVLPDFLQLTAANIRAGMPIDKSLWFAVRPRFGVLAKEIELVAKQTLSGRDLKFSLLEFSNKYDSPTVARSINLLLSGLEAGGEIGDLLNKIATNIQEIRTMKKEMAANVTTYVIFISFATILAAPFLFALSYNLLIVIQRIIGGIDLPKDTMGGGFGSLMSNMSAKSISIPDFQWFCIIMLTVTSFFSAVIIATIQKGSVKEGFKYIPIFIISTLALFFVSSRILAFFLTNII